MLGSDPIEVFATLEVVAKLVQLVSLLLYLGANGCALAWSSLTSAPLWCWLVMVAYVALGQALNFTTYAAIGKVGVYYGFKFGQSVPWCYGFPFNTGLRHPQYLGVVFTLWGGLLMLLSEELAIAGIPLMVMAWSLMYVVMCKMEESGDNDSKDE